MAHFFNSIFLGFKELLFELSFICVLVYLTFQKTIAIFLKYSVQNSSLVAELALPVLKNMNEDLFKLGQCFA